MPIVIPMARDKKEPTEGPDDRLVVRTSPDDKKAFEAAAAAEHLKLSPWARRALHRQLEAEARERARREQAP